MSEDAPKLHIDADWKAQAQAEKEKLAAKEAARAPHGGAVGAEGGAAGAEGELPPADFRTLVATLASQAMMGLGAYGDPQTGRVVIDLAGAQFAIDLLGVLEEKTKGNLTPEEEAETKEVLAHLRSRFVQITTLVAAQMKRDMAAGPADGLGSGVVGSIRPGSAGAGGGKPASPSGLIMPD